MKAFLVISGVIIFVFFFFLVCMLFFSPMGIEDEKGFHVIKNDDNLEEKDTAEKEKVITSDRL